jgi:hypothetical protein
VSNALNRARHWNTTAEERSAAYACDTYFQGPQRIFTRAVDIDAPVSLAFRWVCQLKAAPYSYDLLDNLGRRSPRRLTPGLDHLALGQRFLGGFTLVDFETDRQVTVTTKATFMCGRIVMTIAVSPTSDASTRLVVKIGIESHARWDLLRIVPLSWGDLVMMRKQLLTLKELAERDAREDQPTGAVVV